MKSTVAPLPVQFSFRKKEKYYLILFNIKKQNKPAKNILSFSSVSMAFFIALREIPLLSLLMFKRLFDGY